MSKSTGPRVGFVGAGWTDRVQIPAFRLAGLVPQAIAANRPDSARRAAAAHGIPDVHATWQELLANDQVDVVSICTPPQLHREIAVAALQAGKHVLCEKPTALNVEEAEAMLAAAQAAPDRLAIIDHELRFHPQRQQMRQLIKEGFVGTVLHAEFTRLGAERLDPALPWSWWCDANSGGGMLNALGSHLIDLARWLIGRIEALTAQFQTGHLYRKDPHVDALRQVTADEHVQLLVRFANSAQGAITVSGLTPGGYGMSILVVGTQGALRLDNRDQLWGMQGQHVLQGNWEAIGVQRQAADLSELPNTGAFAVGTFHLAQTLARSLSTGEVLLDDAASFYDGLVVQRCLDAARRASQNGAWETL